jgi:hypothetical protein
MPTKAHGPLQEDYNRALRAAKRAGLKSVVVHVGRATIVMPLDDAYLATLAEGQPPAQDAEETAEAQRRKITMRDW